VTKLAEMFCDMSEVVICRSDHQRVEFLAQCKACGFDGKQDVGAVLAGTHHDGAEPFFCPTGDMLGLAIDTPDRRHPEIAGFLENGLRKIG